MIRWLDLIRPYFIIVSLYHIDSYHIIYSYWYVLFFIYSSSQVQSLRLHRALKTVSAAVCICIGELHHGGQAFIISDKNYSLAMLVRLEVLGVDSLDESEKVTAEEEGCNFLLTVARPVVDSISSSIDIFAALHDQVMIQTDVTKVSRLITYN